MTEYIFFLHKCGFRLAHCDVRSVWGELAAHF